MSCGPSKTPATVGCGKPLTLRASCRSHNLLSLHHVYGDRSAPPKRRSVLHAQRFHSFRPSARVTMNMRHLAENAELMALGNTLLVRKPRPPGNSVWPFALLSLRHSACLAMCRLPSPSMPGVLCPCISNHVAASCHRFCLSSECTLPRKPSVDSKSCLTCSVHDVPKGSRLLSCFQLKLGSGEQQAGHFKCTFGWYRSPGW